MHMWYWAIMVLLILGSIALLCSTFISVKKNKAQDAERRKQSRNGKRYKADQGYDPEEEEDQLQGKKRRSSGQNGSCLLYTSPSPRDGLLSRMPSSA